MGAWLKVNGEAIYGCGATPFGSELTEQPPRWRCTSKPGRLYVHLLAGIAPQEPAPERQNK